MRDSEKETTDMSNTPYVVRIFNDGETHRVEVVYANEETISPMRLTGLMNRMGIDTTIIEGMEGKVGIITNVEFHPMEREADLAALAAHRMRGNR